MKCSQGTSSLADGKSAGELEIPKMMKKPKKPMKNMGL